MQEESTNIKTPIAQPDTGFHLIVAAAGTGTRFTSPKPKQYENLLGCSVILHSIQQFQRLKGLKSVTLIVNKQHSSYYNELILNLPDARIVEGGNSRKESVYNALSGISNIKDDEIVLIHDAARPLITIQEILDILYVLQTSQAASLATPVSDTIRRQDTEDNLGSVVERDGLWALQTPQGFHYGVLKRAHEEGKHLEVTDDTSLVSALGIPVKIVPGSRTNIKITTRDDMAIARKILAAEYETRTGTGFDVHAFESELSGKPLVLCGVTLDYKPGLKGHSDADVGLHAITDALLGALAEGDIGQHFPPSNPKFKDMNSGVFLKHACRIAESKQAEIVNIDATLICEEPKIGPHRDAMRARIAEITNTPISRISVKATTTEQLGFTGRKEGIAAQAAVTICIRNEG